MERDARQTAYDELLRLAAQQGYVTFDDIMECGDRHSLSIQDFDWLSNSVTTFGVIVYAEAPVRTAAESEEEYDDFAQSDYDAVYRRIIDLCPSMRDFVESVRAIVPPQRREISQLAYQIVEGNQYARKRMVEMHLRLALKIALHRAEVYSMAIEDAVGYACIGLITAVDRYDPNTSGAFASYATLWILQNISREQSTQRLLVYYPVHKKEGYFTMYPILENDGCVDCEKLLSCTRAREKVMTKLSCDEKSAANIISQMVPDECIDALVDEQENSEVDFELSTADTILSKISVGTILTEDDMFEEVYDRQRMQVVAAILDKLPPREAKVIRERYGFNGEEKTLEEVGQMFGVTRERIRQIEAKTLRKLHYPSKAKILKEFYEDMT